MLQSSWGGVLQILPYYCRHGQEGSFTACCTGCVIIVYDDLHKFMMNCSRKPCQWTVYSCCSADRQAVMK